MKRRMRYRALGSSGISVSEISFGSWLTVGVGVERDSAAALVERAFELGINFIDTANVYGRGAAEELLGELLAGRPRDSYVLATKLYFPMTDADKGLSAAQIAKQLDASLARLRTDYVDLYQCHRYDTETPLEETMVALTEAVRSGKARHIGFSEWTAPQLEAALAARRGRAVRLEPAPILDPPSRARAGRDPALCARGHLADRLLAARPGCSFREVSRR